MACRVDTNSAMILFRAFIMLIFN